jgi:hypothetical protein
MESVSGIFGKSSGWGQKFVAVDSRGHTTPVAVGLDAHNFRKTPNVHVTRQGDFTWKGENKFNRRSRREVLFNQKVETAETDIPRLSSPYASARLC